MIDFEVGEIFILDLKDDFVMNTEYDLYEFINGDPITAFWLGYHIKEWFEKIEPEQQYLYSKQIRHNREDLEKYLDQIKFWTNKYDSEGKEVELQKLSEYIMNNMFWDEKTEELDKVKLAFFFGQNIRLQVDGQK